MVDVERVRSLLRRVSRDLTDLAAEDPDALLDDPRGLRAVKYSFVTAIEAAVDIAQHLCASEQWGAPATNADAFVVLAQRDVLEPDLGRRLASAVGFRNVLVHEYAVVDDRIVVETLGDLNDLRTFVAAIEQLLTDGE